MLAFCRSSLKSKKYIIILLALAAIAGLGTHAAWSSNGLPRIDNKTLARLAQQHPVVVLFRHAERCDRSTNQCLSDKTGITVKGTQDARELGNAFSADIPDFDLYSSNTVRTIQSATWFSAGKKLTVDKRLLQCGNEIYSAIKDLQSKALMNPLMILVKIIKLRWIHILSYDQMVSRKINNQTTRCANSI
ncbi:lipopolysaccharide core heptose(II)-phosphate phosphatase, partial [Escherichia coli]|nr:lipopolysaccharide core heptose(II)-phosphate phosphatase [Escherichia coli]